MALKTGGKPFVDDLEREVREQTKAMHREEKAAKVKERPASPAQLRSLRKKNNAVRFGRYFSRQQQHANETAARRRKNVAARKSRRANRG